jgi:translation initiation factor IF-2
MVVQLLRDNEVIFEGKIISLKRFKDDVREVKEGLECGINIGYDQVKEGDIIDVFSEEIISRRLER